MKCFYLKKGIAPKKYGFNYWSHGCWTYGKRYWRIKVNPDNRICLNIPQNEDIFLLMKMFADGVIEVEDYPRSENKLKKRIRELEEENKKLKEK